MLTTHTRREELEDDVVQLLISEALIQHTARMRVQRATQLSARHRVRDLKRQLTHSETDHGSDGLE